MTSNQGALQNALRSKALGEKQIGWKGQSEDVRKEAAMDMVERITVSHSYKWNDCNKLRNSYRGGDQRKCPGNTSAKTGLDFTYQVTFWHRDKMKGIITLPNPLYHLFYITQYSIFR